jgi:hypothetical protein
MPHPPYRRLRHFAFDPILSRRIETYGINEVITKLPWEDNLAPGPIDDYIEIVDYDPASQVFYAPVDLNDRYLIAQDGLPPSESSPQFHQQMVYVIARTTISHFERALGRKALWSPRLPNGKFVKHLRIYPHALREANAYYSPAKKALLFGYFPASDTDSGENLPGETVFTCLSHDIVAHETTHALLDGLHPRFNEPSNMDVLALHEAFADIVALFQHFTYPAVLRYQIARTHGDLQRQNLLGELAYQFGQAVGSYGALRSALGSIDPKTKAWVPEKPDPAKFSQTTEPHARGAILVAAVFDAFMTIYKWRIADLLRIATGGSGVLPAGELHPDLVERLAQEAAKTAGHILQMCIRALDYCPPVDVDFGDYLRALITADADLVADDNRNYRLAVIEAFRRRGIYPRDVRSLSEESLLWNKPKDDQQKKFQKVFNTTNLRKLIPDWEVTTKDRENIFDQAQDRQRTLHKWLINNPEVAEAANIVLNGKAPEAFYRADGSGVPFLEVHSVRPARRVGPAGQTVTQLVVEMTQRRRGYYDPETQKEADSQQPNPPKPDFIFRGGCTLIIDPDTAEVRYCIYKIIMNENRLKRMREFLTGDESPSLRATYFGDPRKNHYRQLVAGSSRGKEQMALEPFALLHRSFESKEVQ